MFNVARMLLLVLGVSSLASSAVFVSPAYAGNDCDKSIVGIPPWYKGLTKRDCSIKSPSNMGVEKFVTKIALNVVNIMLVLVVYIAAGFIIYGGYYYLISAGNANRIAKAKSLILNAVIGLIIAAMSAAIVGFVAGRIG